MKKLITLAIVIFSVVGANAQYYVGGSVGFQSNSKETNTNPKSAFTIAPEFGYYLNDKLDIGLDIEFSFDKEQNDDKTTGWAVAPYARYSFFQVSRFEVLAKTSLFFGGDKKEYASGGDSKSTNFGLDLVPLLTYGLTEKVVLFSQLNFMRLNFTSTKPDGGDARTSFGIGVDANNVMNTGNIQIGFVYKF